MQGDISEMKPVTEDVRKWKLIGMGALGVIGIGGSSLGVVFADTFKRLLMLLRA
jgi:glucose-6-phosphate isomerase